MSMIINSVLIICNNVTTTTVIRRGMRWVKDDGFILILYLAARIFHLKLKSQEMGIVYEETSRS